MLFKIINAGETVTSVELFKKLFSLLILGKEAVPHDSLDWLDPELRHVYLTSLSDREWLWDNIGEVITDLNKVAGKEEIADNLIKMLSSPRVSDGMAAVALAKVGASEALMVLNALPAARRQNILTNIRPRDLVKQLVDLQPEAAAKLLSENILPLDIAYILISPEMKTTSKKTAPSGNDIDDILAPYTMEHYLEEQLNNSQRNAILNAINRMDSKKGEIINRFIQIIENDSSNIIQTYRLSPEILELLSPTEAAMRLIAIVPASKTDLEAFVDTPEDQSSDSINLIMNLAGMMAIKGVYERSQDQCNTIYHDMNKLLILAAGHNNNHTKAIVAEMKQISPATLEVIKRYLCHVRNKINCELKEAIGNLEKFNALLEPS